jgi:hypothetical protein
MSRYNRAHAPPSRALFPPRRPSCPLLRRYCCDPLERRVLLTGVSWDGGGDGASWHDPLNWSADSLPGALDDVTINVSGSPTIQIT